MDVRTVVLASWTAGMSATGSLMGSMLSTMADMLAAYGHGREAATTRDCAQGARGVAMIAKDVADGTTDGYERSALTLNVDVLTDMLAEGRYKTAGIADVARVAWLHGMLQGAELMGSHLDMLERTGTDPDLLAYARGIVSKTRGTAWLLLVSPPDGDGATPWRTGSDPTRKDSGR